MFRRLPGGGVIVDLRTDQIFELNDTGARIWEAIEAGQRAEVIPAILAAEFDVDAGTAASETSRLLDELSRAGLIES